MGEDNEQDTETPTIPPIVWNVSNLSARAAEVAATTIVMMITTVEWPRLIQPHSLKWNT
jgi:hypothetical protein